MDDLCICRVSGDPARPEVVVGTVNELLEETLSQSTLPLMLGLQAGRSKPTGSDELFVGQHRQPCN